MYYFCSYGHVFTSLNPCLTCYVTLSFLLFGLLFSLPFSSLLPLSTFFPSSLLHALTFLPALCIFTASLSLLLFSLCLLFSLPFPPKKEFSASLPDPLDSPFSLSLEPLPSLFTLPFSYFSLCLPLHVSPRVPYPFPLFPPCMPNYEWKVSGLVHFAADS